MPTIWLSVKQVTVCLSFELHVHIHTCHIFFFKLQENSILKSSCFKNAQSMNVFVN